MSGSKGLGRQCESVPGDLVSILDDIKKKPDLRAFFDRWELQDIFRSITLNPRWLTEFEKKRVSKGDLPRVCNCCRTSNGEQVALYHEPGKKVGYYGGLQTCGSIWICPICAAKITEFRKNEIVKASESWINRDPDNQMVMVTFTIPHRACQSLTELLGHNYVIDENGKRRKKTRGFKGAKHRLKEQGLKKGLKPFKEIMHDNMVRGSITALELTWGFNGWHVHHHDLYFLQGNWQDLEQMHQDLTDAWLHACNRARISIPSVDDFKKRAVKLDVAKTPADYISKWGIEAYKEHREMANSGWGAGNEISKAHVKRGRPGHYTPWDLARMIAENKSNRRLYTGIGSVLAEYMRIIKGSAHLQWSNGLKKFFGLYEIDDESIADTAADPDELKGIFSQLEWYQVKFKGLRAKVLAMAPHYSMDEIKHVVMSLEREGNAISRAA